MFRRWRRNRQLGKVKAGNGSALQPYRWWQLFGRSIFFIELQEAQGKHVYAVDARYFEDDLSGQEGDSSETGEDIFAVESERGQSSGRAAETLSNTRMPKPGKAPAALYRDGVQLYRSKLPATFEVPGGVIEVAASGYGAKRMHFIDGHGNEEVLVPHRSSAEGLRARFDGRFPLLSKSIGVLAIVVLLVGLAVGIPQGVEMITSIDSIAQRFGTFTSPIQLPTWLNTTTLVAGLLAGTERALTLRNHWLIDVDTTWTAFG
ncbi:hypothetical protein [Leucobacter sp. GX24907]